MPDAMMEGEAPRDGPVQDGHHAMASFEIAGSLQSGGSAPSKRYTEYRSSSASSDVQISSMAPILDEATIFDEAMQLPGGAPPQPAGATSDTTRSALVLLLQGQEECRSFLTLLSGKLDTLQMTLEAKTMTMTRKASVPVNSRVKPSSTLHSMTGEEAPRPAPKGEDKGGYHARSMTTDMFSLNARHNKQLLKKKRTAMSLAVADGDQSVAVADKDSNSASLLADRRSSGSLARPLSLDNELPLMPGSLREEDRDLPLADLEEDVSHCNSNASGLDNSLDVSDPRDDKEILGKKKDGDDGCHSLAIALPEEGTTREQLPTLSKLQGKPEASSSFLSRRGSRNSLEVPSPERQRQTVVAPALVSNGSGASGCSRGSRNAVGIVPPEPPSPAQYEFAEKHSGLSSFCKSPQIRSVSSQDRFAARSSSQPAPNRKTHTSLDDLRAQHNVKIVTEKRLLQQTIDESPSLASDSEEYSGEHSMVWGARIWLALVGIVDARRGVSSKLLAFFTMALIAGASGALLLTLQMHSEHRFVGMMTACYAVGAVTCVLLLRLARPTEDSLSVLLGPQEFQLDEYAHKHCFLEPFRAWTTLRTVAVLGLWSMMVAFRILAGIFTVNPEMGALGYLTQDVLSLSSFGLVMLVVVGIYFVQLHVSSGLELAIDSFSTHFFEQKDIELAMEEWNVLQAMIRCASSRIESSYMVIGSSCLASLVMLATEVWSNPKLLHGALPAALWLGWVYPPVLLLLYSLTRAAAVTEKCTRVAPFINSWDFSKDDEPVEFEDDDGSLHLGRQYIVQYIMQSEAGFYVKGVRLTNFTVMKLCYGFGAISFALLSHTMTAVITVDDMS